MRAVAALAAERSLRLIDHPEPEIETSSEVLVDVLDVGVCGTDREIARFDYGLPPAGSPYLVIGHESLGRVAEVGADVSRVAPGDLVVTMVRRPCPHASCRACTAGRQDFCFTGDFTERGIRGRHGFMTERIVDDACFMHVVPAALRDVGVLVEPLTIAEKALIQVWDVQERLPWTLPHAPAGSGRGQRAVVLGAGPVGLLGALALRVRGFDTFVYSLEPAGSAKARWVESVGAHYISSGDTPIRDLEGVVGDVDLFYEATGAAKVSFEALETLGPNGVFIFTGVPGRKAPIEIDGAAIMRRLVLENQLLFGTVNAGPEAFVAAIADLERFNGRWPDALAQLITGRFGPEDAAELLTGPTSGIKRVVSFG